MKESRTVLLSCCVNLCLLILLFIKGLEFSQIYLYYLCKPQHIGPTMSIRDYFNRRKNTVNEIEQSMLAELC
jgi:hypothetical protein